MIESIKSITEIPDLRRRILFTLAMLAVYRLGAVIPTPGINAEAFEQLLISRWEAAFLDCWPCFPVAA